MAERLLVGGPRWQRSPNFGKHWSAQPGTKGTAPAWLRCTWAKRSRAQKDRGIWDPDTQCPENATFSHKDTKSSVLPRQTPLLSDWAVAVITGKGDREKKPQFTNITRKGLHWEKKMLSLSFQEVLK